MKVIIEHKGEGDSFEIKEAEEKELAALSQAEKYVEMDFKMRIESNKQLPEMKLFESQSMLLATIGVKQLSDRVDAYYDIHTKKLEIKNNNRSLKETYWMSCIAQEELTASEYIHCIWQLAMWTKLYKRPLIIYSQIAPAEKYYRYRSLTGKIVNQLLKDVQSALLKWCPKNEIALYYLPARKDFEFYIERGIYLSCTYEEMMRRIVSCLETDPEGDLRQVYRTQPAAGNLFEDLFYEMIPDEQKIYVPFGEDSTGTVAYLRSLGFEVIEGTASYGLIYDRKDKINHYASEIKPYVISRFECPILEREGVEAAAGKGTSDTYTVLEGDLPYKGKDVYIGIVSNTGVDYRLTTLRNADGTTRIAGMWYQTEGEEGSFYTKEQINAALQSNNPEEMIPIPLGSSQNTMILNIAAGKNEKYEGIATQAEFLVAKVNTAPEKLQEIYGGMFNANNIQMAELIVGIWKLQRLAKEQKKSLIFYVPYYTNIDSHDGFSFYNNLAAFAARERGNALIVPTGGEGNEKHHQTLYDGSVEEARVYLKCAEDGQNVIGLLTQRYLNDWEVEVTSPGGEKIQIKRQGQYAIDSATIYSQGEKLNYYNGSKDIMFRISNMGKGDWVMEVKTQNQKTNRVDLWISGRQSNPNVTLFPQNPYVTIGSIGNVRAVTCVAGYDLDEMATLKDSGRGYTMDDRVKPNLAAGGIAQTVDMNGNAVVVEGTEVSAGIILGAAATIFEKWCRENGKSMLNSVLLNSILLEYISQFTNIPFPNPNQGYGVFERDTLSKILLTPFNA